MIIFKKLGNLHSPRKGYHQYPTPILVERYGVKFMQLAVTARDEDGKSRPVIFGYKYNPESNLFSYYDSQDVDFYPQMGRPEEGGMSIQDFTYSSEAIGLANRIDAYVTCYSPGDPKGIRYKTLIKRNHFKRRGDSKLFTESSPVYDPLIVMGGEEFSVCTPHRMPNTNVLYYNSHTDWTIRDTGNKEEWSPDYLIKARFLLANGETTSSKGDGIILPPNDEDNEGMECQTRPWTFEFKGTKYFLMSTRSPWRYKTEVEHSYKTRLFKFEDNSLKEVEFAWQGKSEFMEAYTTALVIDGRCFLFYNSNFNSPVMVAEMIVT